MLAASLLVLLPQHDEALAVELVAAPPLLGNSGLLGEHRPPLAPEALIKLPLGAIRPRGWLLYQLEAMADGMHGRLPEISPWLEHEGNAWRHPQGGGEHGWEELPYWLKGFVSLAHLTQRAELVRVAQDWIDAILASQRDDGWFGPESNLRGNDLWPNMIALWALQSHHEATGDPRVPPFLERYFRWQAAQPPERLLPGSWQKVRGGDNLASVLWLYNRGGELWLLDLARTLHERTGDWSSGFPSWHGVNICQGFREPAQFFSLSHDPLHLAASTERYHEVMERYGQVPGGMFAADENCRPGYADPRQAAEACSMVEFMLSHEMLLGLTGDPKWADRCEEIAFNSLPAAFSPDARALHYLTAPNMVQLDHENHAPGIENRGMMLAYSPHGAYRCCQHNVAHGWPYFTERLWMATRDGGLAAVLYAPATVDAAAAGGSGLAIEVQTDYPFGSLVQVRLGASAPVRAPLYLRVPGWSAGCTVRAGGASRRFDDAAGRYLRLERTWQDGDVVELELEPRFQVQSWPAQRDAVSVRYGPLWLSLRIGERWIRNGGDEIWPEWDVLPAGPWNYALELDPADPARSFTLLRRPGSNAGQPFSLGGAPLLAAAKARRVPEWGTQYGLVSPLQDSPVLTSEPVEDVLLVPMGAARLRISVFPVAGEGAAATRWVAPLPPPAASHVHDDPFALNDGLLPRASNDHDIPRFTWWDHLGTVEWVQYDYAEPRRLTSAAVYWFDDSGTGRCRVPASWRLLAKDGESWDEIRPHDGYGVAADQWNEVRFAPITTTALRLEVRLQDGCSGGILEWRTGGE